MGIWSVISDKLVATNLSIRRYSFDEVTRYCHTHYWSPDRQVPYNRIMHSSCNTRYIHQAPYHIVNRKYTPINYSGCLRERRNRPELVYPGNILRMVSANERRRYTVTSSLISWARTQNNLWFTTLMNMSNYLSILIVQSGLSSNETILVIVEFIITPWLLIYWYFSRLWIPEAIY